jgi:nucleotide-binding universal stress UspA family protein
VRELDAIAVGDDGGGSGTDALALGELLARTTSSRLLVVRAVDDSGADDSAADAERLATEIDGVLAASSTSAEARVLTGAAAEALQQLAESDARVGTLVVGSTHRAGVGRVLPGSTAGRLLSGAPCSVAVAPRGYASNPRFDADTGPRAGGASSAKRPSLRPSEDLRVVDVGFDASPEAWLALDRAAALAGAARATMRVIAIDRPLPAAAPRHPAPMAGMAADDLQTKLHDAVAELPSELRTLAVFDRGDPAHHLLAQAEQGVDLLVLGSRGHGPLRSVVLGSVSTKMLASAPCPVIVTPRSSGARLAHAAQRASDPAR